MKILLKSLEELKEEYGVEKIMDNYSSIIDNGAVATNLINLFGKVVEAKYDKVSDSYIVDDWYLHPNLIKGEVIGYTIKKLSDGKKCTFSL